MRKRMLEIAVAVAVLFASGCAFTASSLNVQRSAFRGSGDTGATTMLENQNEEEVADIVVGVVGICKDVLDFLNTGDIAELTKNELKAKILEVVPEGSRDFANDMLSLVSVTNVDVQKIGARNVKRIRAFVNGVIRGAEKYNVGDRE